VILVSVFEWVLMFIMNGLCASSSARMIMRLGWAAVIISARTFRRDLDGPARKGLAIRYFTGNHGDTAIIGGGGCCSGF